MPSVDYKRPPYILAVDDLPDNLELIEAILDGEGYRIRYLDSGVKALDHIRKEPPDLVLLDVMMPDLDGYDVTRHIRQDQSLPYIPILLITADDQSNVVRGLDAGADDFIRKPVDIDELLARVRSLLRLKHSMDAQADMLKQRDDFVARLTHDLRTPLVAVNRVLQFCLEGVYGEPPSDMQTALTNVLHNNDNLLQMANTLLEVYRHEAGHKHLAFSPVNLWELAATVITELKPLCQEKSLYLTLCQDTQAVDREDSQPQTETPQFWVKGDHLELRRVITNLIGNAIKFTEQGGITVRLESHETDSVQLIVSDTGPGITPEEQKQIFEWFRPGKHRRANSGLGLHLSRRIANIHGGSLQVTSSSEAGSDFTLKLPRMAISSPKHLNQTATKTRAKAPLST